MTKRNLLLSAAGLLVMLVALPAAIWSVYAVDKTITSGEAYGLSIGETKDLAGR